ncbi:MAG TPA: hypothetical protein PKU77_07200 [Ferruginibacter sp.]|nr:hypothetical protein [Ferruginibacter sp.]
MKLLPILFFIGLAACCVQKEQANKNSDDGFAQSDLPACIDSLLKNFENEDVQNPPRKIISYRYQNKTVYYVPAICCDFFSDLYDANCKLIAHPDGGITGKGDGSLPDFHSMKKEEKILWHDKRKQ